MQGVELLSARKSESESSAPDGKTVTPDTAKVAQDLLKGGNPKGGGDGQGGDEPDGQAKPEDTKTGVEKQLEELQKLFGRQTTELGELRKQLQTRPTAKVEEEDDDPDPPIESEFESPEKYKKALKAYNAEMLDRREAKRSQADAAKGYDAQVKASGIPAEEWGEIQGFFNDPANLSPLNLRRMRNAVTDPNKALREASEAVQQLATRKGAPSSSGAGGGSGDEGGDMSPAELKSAKEVFASRTLMERSRAADQHVKKFGRLLKP